jgi:hypothetical protein
MTRGVFGRAVENHWLEVPITSEKHVWHNCIDAVDSCTFHLCRVWSTGFLFYGPSVSVVSAVGCDSRAQGCMVSSVSCSAISRQHLAIDVPDHTDALQCMS